MRSSASSALPGVGRRDQARAAVVRVGRALDQAQLLEPGEHARGGRALDPLARGELAGRQRPVALDRRERRRQRGGELAAGLLAQPPGGPHDRRAAGARRDLASKSFARLISLANYVDL